MSNQVQTGVEKLCHTIIHIRRPSDDGTATYPYQVAKEGFAEGRKDGYGMIDTIETGKKIHLYYPQNNFKIFPIGPKMHPMHVSTADPQAIARVGQMTKMSCSKTCAVIPRI